MIFNKEEFFIKRLGRDDVLLFQKLTRLFQQVFELRENELTGEAYLVNLLSKP